jgi:hypothetical protein
VPFWLHKTAVTELGFFFTTPLMRSAIKYLLTGAILLPAYSTSQAEWLRRSTK